MKFQDIEHSNIENGDGIRVLLWVSGCFHNCEECHNPITHDPDDGVEFTEESLNELLDAMSPDYIQGITLTGGDGLCYYPSDVQDIIKEVRNRFGSKKDIWLYTGYNLDWILNEILTTPYKDVRDIFYEIITNIDVLCDGRYEKDKNMKDYHWVGSTNQRVIDMKKTLESGCVIFHEPEQEKLCTTSNEKTNELIKKFNMIKK